MEIGDFVITLERALSFLRESESSLYANLTVEEVIRELEE